MAIACLWYLAGYAQWAIVQRRLRKRGVLTQQEDAEFFLFMIFFWPVSFLMYVLFAIAAAIGFIVRFFREEW